MRIALAGIVLLAWAGAAQARFDPPAGTWRYDTTETRPGGTFVAARRLVFRRDGQETIAEVTLETTRHEGTPDAVGTMFDIGTAALKDRTIRFHIDRGGGVTVIDDIDTIWTAFCDGIDAMAAGKAPLGGARSSIARGVSAQLRTLDPARRQSMLASVILPVIAAQAPAVGARPVQVPMKIPGGHTVMIDGRETTAAGADTIVRVATHAESGDPGPLAAGTVRAEDSKARLVYDLERSIDPRSGLVLQSRETARWTAGSSTVTTVTTMRLSPMVF